MINNSMIDILSGIGFFLSMEDIESEIKDLISPYYDRLDNIRIHIINKARITEMMYDKEKKEMVSAFLKQIETSSNVEWRYLTNITETNRVFILSPQDHYIINDFTYQPSIIKSSFTYPDSQISVTLASKTMNSDGLTKGIVLNSDDFTKFLRGVREYHENIKIDEIDKRAKEDFAKFTFYVYYLIVIFLYESYRNKKDIFFDKYIQFNNDELSDIFGEGKMMISSADMIELNFPVPKFNKNVRDYQTKESAVV